MPESQDGWGWKLMCPSDPTSAHTGTPKAGGEVASEDL